MVRSARSVAVWYVVFVRTRWGQELDDLAFEGRRAVSAATTQRTDIASDQVKKFFAAQPQVANTVLVRGFSFFGQGQANAIMFTPLKPWDERKGAENSAQSIAGKAMGAFMGIKEAFVFSLSPPSIPELGTASGFTFKLQDRGGNGRAALVQARNQMLGGAMQSKSLANVRPEGQEDAPVLKVDIDRIKARALGLSIGDVNATLAIAFGSAYANDFTREGRVLRVLIQADAASRMTPQDVTDGTVRIIAIGDVGHVPPTLRTGALGDPERSLALPAALTPP